MSIDAFIRRLERLDAEPDAPLAERRAAYERVHRERRPPDPAGLRVEDTRIEGVDVRRFTPRGAQSGCVVYLHGGGWNLGSAASHHGITADLAVRLGREVVSVDYRRVPEVSYAEALGDCVAVTDTCAPLAVVGDSAGGRLAIDVAHRGWQGVLGLIYPVVGAPTAETLGDDAPLLSRADILALWQSVAAAVPAIPAECAPTPAIEVLAVARDPLTRPLEAAVAAWRQAGAEVGYRCAPGMVHSALHGHAELPAMRAAWQAFCQALAARLS
ncbi:alpha/beta hydrolase fold domain-containing protein [Salinicola sp. JS01]|uniref:alpha/beta hydrolase fold domain-containing protein n=1 Tax=Salinicola sp. JS01 TaxID=3050071 RepID=UPI00255BDFCA|nr:alpha/beta hydrolase fold domain-containing protein [Salinicola sp. JS01]WIX33871.1 alpha/beta hydrolase fold domain-containing protein [Salinicola sp. JS01]